VKIVSDLINRKNQYTWFSKCSHEYWDSYFATEFRVGQMGRRLTIALAVAVLLFVLVPTASADEITTNAGFLLTPEGSQVTSVFVLPSFGVCFNVIGVDFQFPGGTGSTVGCQIDIDATFITFTVPVTDLSLSVIPAGSDFAILSANNFSEILFQCGVPSTPSPCPATIDLTFSGPISDLALGIDGDSTFRGIESLSFNVDAGDPPTSSLCLLGFGLIGLLSSFRRKARLARAPEQAVGASFHDLGPFA
jgi:hypothetical protein